MLFHVFEFLRAESFPTRLLRHTLHVYARNQELVGERDEISNNRIASRSRHLLTT